MEVRIFVGRHLTEDYVIRRLAYMLSGDVAPIKYSEGQYDWNMGYDYWLARLPKDGFEPSPGLFGACYEFVLYHPWQSEEFMGMLARVLTHLMNGDCYGDGSHYQQQLGIEITESTAEAVFD